MSSQPEMTRQMVPSLRLLAPQLVVAGVLPVVAYALLRPHVASDATALAAVMVFPVAEIAFERVRHGRFEPIGIIALMGIAVGLVGALVFHGDATLLKVRDSLFTGVFGLVCLASLGARRPAMYYLGRSFATGDDPAMVREFDTIWELPGVPRRFLFVTGVWGVTLVAEAVTRTALALMLPTQTFLVISPILNWGVIGALLWFSTWYTRRSERRVVAEAIEVQTA
ncbi:MAG TPA: VC0807 family protein [Acidimicrobiia bacterium]